MAAGERGEREVPTHGKLLLDFFDELEGRVPVER